MTHTLNVDFVTEDATTEAEVLSEANAWLTENQLTATVEIDKLVGPGGGWPNLNFTTQSKEELRKLAVVYCGGDEMNANFLINDSEPGSV